ADGMFDPVKDMVQLKDGTTKTNYYRNILGVKFYQPLDKSKYLLPPSGWCSWYYYYNRVTADEVKQNTDWIADHLKDYGAQYVQIDDGWQGSGGRDSARNWELVNTNHFPDGMAAVAKYIEAHGLKPGLWIAPHGQSSDAFVRANPGVFLLGSNGATASDTWEGKYLLDPTSPAGETYLANLFKRLSGWGYNYFKIDGQPIVVDEYAKKASFMMSPSSDAAGLYRKTLGTIRGAIGPDRYLLGCWGIPVEGAGIMNGSRTGGDVVLGWGGFQVALRPTLQFYYLHNIVWYSDPDALLVRSPLTLEQARVWATLEGLTGQALMSSDRLTDLGTERVELLRRVYPATDIRPLDLFPTERYKRIWDLKVNHLGRRYDVVGVFNFDTDNADQVYLNWAELGLAQAKRMHVFDFWNQEYLGAWPEGIAVPTEPTSCRVLTIIPDSGSIELISTSRHITQGPVELKNWNQDGNSFKGTSHLIKGDPYQLSFAFPAGTNYTVTRVVARAGLHHLPVEVLNHQGWSAIKITSPKTQDVEWKIEFGPAKAFLYPPSAPEEVFVRPVGLDCASLNWREQYYLNAGYEVYLDDKLLGQTPEARFLVRNVDPTVTHTARIKTVGEGGAESTRTARIEFNLSALIPRELSLAELQPVQSTGRWNGYEIGEMLTPAPLVAGGQHYAAGLAAFAGSEMEFDLHGLYETFTAKAAVDDNSRGGAAAEFSVLADGKELWHSETLKKGEAAVAVSVPINGAKKLILRTQNPGATEGRAQADWLEPKILKAAK
ncbi:MAG TPA: NPCBM/NEW2 domain-containing protein, partial [Verrucomicrobiae bacterium]|nr:NPCBM/NEW2 domain-containing protein [Verrucomicrobiae bacterium]